MSKDIDKNISQHLSGKHNGKPLIRTKQSTTDVLNTASKRTISKRAEAKVM